MILIIQPPTKQHKESELVLMRRATASA